MKYLLFVFLLAFSTVVFAETCDIDIAEAIEKRAIELEADIILKNQFSYITSLSGLRKAAVTSNSFEFVEEIDDELLVRLAQVIHFSKKSSDVRIEEVLNAYERFISDQSYYPLTWSSEENLDLKSMMDELTSDV